MNNRRPLRADAAINRARIIEAARSVYAEQGVGAPFDAIAVRAGVANATLYRHFPSPEALRTAIHAQRLDEADAFLRELATEPDAWTRVERYLEWIAVQPDIVLLDTIFDPDTDPGLSELQRRLQAVTRRLFADAQADGRLRADFAGDDIEVAIYALAQVGSARQITPAQRARFVDILLAGLRSEAQRY